MKTDTELQRDVLDELDWEPSVDAAEIGVSVENGIVILNGTVKTLNEKWSAERAVQRVRGVQAVTDELVVKLAADGQPSDVDIAREAVNALDWNASIPRNRIAMVVENGRIILQGHVEFNFQRNMAEAAVRNIKGVKAISNLIVVKTHVFPADVKKQIQKALERAAQLDAQNISVEAAGGKIILRGNVRSWAERREAERVAWAAPGVSNVQNDIRIVIATAA